MECVVWFSDRSGEGMGEVFPLCPHPALPGNVTESVGTIAMYSYIIELPNAYKIMRR